MKSNQKRSWLASTMAACVLVGALAVGGTMAYLTDNESATNTFTVGKVDVALIEPNYPGNNDPSVNAIVPNQEIQKDPKVTNTGVNDAIVFMSVEVPVKNVTVVRADGTKGTKEKTELFWFKDAADTQGTFANHFSDQWLELTAKGEKDMAAGDTNTYVFAYKNAVAKDATTDSLFDKVQLKNVIEGEVTAGEAQNVVVNTYAIQASEVLEGNTDLTDTLTEENLGKIYDIYFNQNSEKSSDSEAEPEVTESAAILVDGTSFNTAMKTLAGGLSNVHGIKNTDVVPEDVNTLVVSSPESEKEILMYFYDGNIYVSTEAEKVYLNPDSFCMFVNCKKLMNIDALSDWDVSSVTNMYGMFGNCAALTNVDALSGWDVSSVTNMYGMFYNCAALTNVDGLSDWNVGSVTNMREMFDECAALTNVDGLSDWNVSSVTNMYGMFDNCAALTNVDALSGWDVSSVTNMYGMFGNCAALTNVDALSGWDVSSVTNMYGMFDFCESLTNVDALSGWNVSSVTNMSYMFHYCAALTNVDGLSGWDVGSVTNMYGMFYNCAALTNVDGLSDWNVGSVTKMGHMFYSCTKLQNSTAINNWNISNVTNFVNMFQNCPSHPEFTKRPGTWDSRGTFIPSN